MCKTFTSLLAVLLLLAGGTAFAQQDAQKSALSWQKQARDTRVAVVSVADELGKMDASGKPDAAGLINDAMAWLEKGDAEVAQADTKMTAEDWKSASSGYNMAWQYYAKAATAGLAAKTMLESR